MADWPTGYLVLPAGSVNPLSPCCLLHFQTGGQSGASFVTGTVWPLANRAIYIPFYLDTTVTAYQIATVVVTQSGNLDVGIYDEYGARRVSSGSTAVAVAGLQRINIADTVLTPGLYFMAMSVDNTTASFRAAAAAGDVLALDITGLRTQNLASVTLPNPATPAAPASGYVPLLAILLNPN